MVSVRFVAQDINSKERTNSSIVYFKELNQEVIQLIELNRQKIQRAMPLARVLALISRED